MIVIWAILILQFIIAVIMPKHQPAVVLYGTSCFAINLGLVVDNIFDIWLDLYGYFNKGIDLEGFIAVTITYFSVNMLYINWFPVHRSLIIKGLYILGWSLFSIVFEWGILQTGFFYYNGWHHTYSMILYPIIFLILYGNYRIVFSLSKK
ncbi:hypothetical protein MUO14_15085 [Halobacillus shinanisalinarum]|uniref:Rod shape-determining protein MreD n=1 Tax=Halobacillus shinanisalinarum TaxID=2932258 RepID=A0ABY4GUJ6_9BACI|nr:hypothetical protein [Halobacillus shinanisalinarum]UOQ91840.1 hypothetical protein MUO14_15085 [Halobacillus shinanisalinarum]